MRLIEYFAVAAAAFPERPALIADDQIVSFGDLDRLIRNLANALRARSFRPGDITAFVAPDSPSAIVCMLGTLAGCGVWAPIHNNASDATVEEYLRFVNPTWLFYHSAREALAVSLRRTMPQLKCVCVDQATRRYPSLKSLLTERTCGPTAQRRESSGLNSELVGLFQTGGTTAAPKAIECDTVNWIAAMEAFKYYAPRCNHPICLTVTPLSHTAGTMAFTMLTLGATIIVSPRYVPSAVLATIERARVTHMFAVPAVLYGLVETAIGSAGDYSSLRMLWVSGGAVTPKLIRRAVDVFGPCVYHSYGQFEAPHIAWLDARTIEDAIAGIEPDRLASCGRPTYHLDLTIVNQDGQPVAQGETGEIVVSGPAVRRYFKGDESRRRDSSRKHCTGDIGHCDKDGFLYIDGRVRDIIKTAGANVWASEVEATILEMDGIAECAVVGLKDEVLGERIAAVIVRVAGATHANTVDDSRVIDYCKARLGRMRAPTQVEVWPDLLRTAVGKVDKTAIAARLAKNASGIPLGKRAETYDRELRASLRRPTPIPVDSNK